MTFLEAEISQAVRKLSREDWELYKENYFFSTYKEYLEYHHNRPYFAEFVQNSELFSGFFFNEEDCKNLEEYIKKRKSGKVWLGKDHEGIDHGWSK